MLLQTFVLVVVLSCLKSVQEVNALPWIIKHYKTPLVNSVDQSGCANTEIRVENMLACEGQQFGTLVSYPGDCNKYLVCNCIYPTVEKCPSGLYFNNKVKSCDWPLATTCVAAGGNDGGVTAPATPPISSTPPPTPPALPANICVNQSVGTTLPVSGDCGQFIICLGANSPSVVSCPDGAYYDPAVAICIGGASPTICQ